MNARLANLSAKMKGRFGKFSRGVTAVEYALLVFLISIVIVPALIVIGPQLGQQFEKAKDAISHTRPNTGGDNTCIANDNTNGYFDGWYWSYTVPYTDADSGLSTGTMTYDSSNPTGLWDGALQTPWSFKYLLLSQLGELLSNSSSVNDDSLTGDPIAFTILKYEHGEAWAYDNDMGITSPGPRPSQAAVEDYVATLGFQTGSEAEQTPFHTPRGSGIWNVEFTTTLETYYAALSGVPGTPENVVGSPDAGSGGVQKATPPDGAPLTCPAVDTGDWNTPQNGVLCVTDANTGTPVNNAYWDNMYWTESRYYQPVDYSNSPGNLTVDGSGSHWYGTQDWSRDGVVWTQAEADAAVADGTVYTSSSWTASVTDDGGVLYASAPQAGLDSGNVGCPTNPSNGGRP